MQFMNIEKKSRKEREMFISPLPNNVADTVFDSQPCAIHI